MAGAHATPPPRALRAAMAAPPGGARSRRVARPSGVGWWRPPKGSRRPGPGEETRRRAAAPETAPAPPRRRRAAPPARRRGARWPGGLLPARLRPSPPGSQHRRPVTPEERADRRRRRIRLALLSAVAAVLLGPVVLFAVGYLFFTVPSPDDAVNNQVALVSYGDGTQLTRLVPEEGNRIKVPIEQVPVQVRQAVLAAEDRTFYSNPGFDLSGILRAAWNQLRGGSGGGSTITQQFVKNALVGDAPTLWRKYKEVVLAVKISQERSKDEILGDYLNAIYFGRGAYGIQSGSLAFFGKSVEELTVAEGAMLAGLIQSPSRWDPAINPERAIERWEFVLDGMVSQSWLGPAERAAALFPPTVPRRPSTRGVPGDHRGHIVNAVRAELASLGISEQDLSQEGLRISTTIDPVRQQEAVEAAQSALEGQPDDLRAAMVSIDPETGGVLAYYGGENGHGLDYARVLRLAGSTFKPFVVLAGLLQDPPIGLGEVYDGAEIPGLRNAPGAECDRCDIKQAMTVSNNVVFNTLAREVGPEAVADAARAAGITAPLEDPNAGIALGNKEVSVVDLASAYATIAAGGVWRQPHLVARVVTADDRVLYDVSTEGEQRFPERVARNVAEAMLDVAERDGLGLDRPVAAKTGTVQHRLDGENNDAWMAGFTPNLSTSVWIGTDRNEPIRRADGTPISGDGLPGEIWHEFMSDALAEVPAQTFEPFRPIGEAPTTLAPNESPEPTRPPTPTPSPAPTEPVPTPAPDPDPPPGSAVPPVEEDPARRAAGARESPETTPTPTTRQDCSVIACG